MTNPPTTKAFRHERAAPAVDHQTRVQAQIAALEDCLAASPPRTQRPMSDAEVNWESLQEQRAEDMADQRANGRVSEQECLARADREAGWLP